MTSIVLTMVVGFAWGGWVTGGTAQTMADKIAQDAVVKRLAPMCVVQFNRDPAKDQKLKELTATDSWQKGDYVEKQGWYDGGGCVSRHVVRADRVPDGTGDAMATGTVARLVKDRGFGFLRTEDGVDVFFHRSSLQGAEFDSLSEGQAVEFEIEKGAKGSRAANLKLR